MRLAVTSGELLRAIKEETMRMPFALSLALFSATSTIAHAQDQTVSVGAWTIATSSKADKFDSCTMSRSANDLDITFLRTHDGLLLLLDSSKWKLERVTRSLRRTGSPKSATPKAIAAHDDPTMASQAG